MDMFIYSLRLISLQRHVFILIHIINIIILNVSFFMKTAET